MQLLDLPAPKVIETFDFETIKARKLARVIELFAAKGIEYVPSASDDIMTMIETDAYDEMLLRAQINNGLKAQLLLFAQGADLDHLGASRFGVTRLEGAKPYASFTFTLSLVQGNNITLPAGLKLTDGKGTIALLLEDVVIVAGNVEGTGTVELQMYAETSEVKTETITTPLPYVIKAQQNENYHDGAAVEDDERLRERIWLARDRKSTAGATSTYTYFAKTADARIADVKVLSPSDGAVSVYLLSNDGAADDVMIGRVEEALNEEKIRPLTDKPNIYSADIIDIDITAAIILYDLTYENSLRSLIEHRIADATMRFGRSLSMAKLYGLFENEQVKDATIIEPASSLLVESHQVIRVNSVTLNFSGASL